MVLQSMTHAVYAVETTLPVGIALRFPLDLTGMMAAECVEGTTLLAEIAPTLHTALKCMTCVEYVAETIQSADLDVLGILVS